MRKPVGVLVEAASRVLFHRSYVAFDVFAAMHKHAFGSRARKQPLFFKESRAEALRMWNAGPYLYTCRVDVGEMFIPSDMYVSGAKYTDDPDSLTPLGVRVMRELFRGDLDATLYMVTGAYDVMESSETLDWLQARGYDSFMVSESGKMYRDRSVAVFDPRRVTVTKTESVS